MPTSYTSLLGLALPVTGELAGQWGTTVNDYITQYVDSSVAGTQTISGSQTAVTLSVTNGSSLVTAGSGATGSAQFQIINCTGNPAGLLTITAPASSRQYIIINATSTSQSVKIVGSGPTTGVTILSGEKAHVAWNGSDFVKIATQSGNGDFVTVDTTNLEVTNIKAKDGTAAASIADSTGVISITSNPILSGGTANGVLYLNGSKVATSGSALTFDGSQLVIDSLGEQLKLTRTTVGSGTLNIGGSGELAYASGFHIWFNAAKSTEWMRLDSSGNLLVGTTSAISKLTVQGASDIRITVNESGSSVRTDLISQTTQGQVGTVSNHPLDLITNGTGRARIDTSGNLVVGGTTATNTAANRGNISINGTSNAILSLSTGNTARGYVYHSGSDMIINATTGTLALQANGNGALIDSSGNLGLGVTPNAWSLKALQVGQSGFLGTATDTNISANAYYNSGWKYAANGGASLFNQSGSVSSWYVGANNTSGANATWTLGSAAMTLDASGYLLLNTTTSNTFANYGQFILGAGSSGSIINFQQSGSSKFHIRNDVGTPSLTIESRSGTNGILVFGTNETERARITSGGNVCIGTTSALGGAGLTVSGGGGYITLNSTTVGYTTIEGWDSGTTKRWRIGQIAFGGADGMAFYTGASDTERARIDSSGQLMVGNNNSPVWNSNYRTIAVGNDAAYIVIDGSSNGTGRPNCYGQGGMSNNTYYDGTNSRAIGTGAGSSILFGGGYIETSTMASVTAGSIQTLVAGPYLAVSGTSWTNSSDEKLKNITGLIENAIDKVLQIRAARFTWKSDKTNKPQVGLIAQDLQKVLPEVVVVPDSSEEEMVNTIPKYLGVNYDQVIPLAIAAIQEQQTIIQSLTARIAALESKGV